MELSYDEVSRYAGQVLRQRSYLTNLKEYQQTTCTNTEGLTGALDVLVEPLLRLAEVDLFVLGRSGVGMSVANSLIRSALRTYQSTDTDAAELISGQFRDAPDWFPDLRLPVQLPDDVRPDYRDSGAPSPAPPAENATTTLEEKLQDVGGVLGMLEDAWGLVVGGSLLEKIVKPLAGNYGRLQWLSEAYANLGDGIYDVAWNLRGGLYTVAPHWNGEAGQEFEWHMFRWHMGLGGLGDAHHLVAQALNWLYELIADAVTWVLEKINVIIEKVSKYLVKKASGPFGWVSTVVDVVTGELYDKIREVVEDVNRIRERIEEVKEKIEEYRTKVEEGWELLQTVVSAAGSVVSDPAGAAREWLTDARDAVVGIEDLDGHEPALGAGRLALLPLPSDAIMEHE